MPSSGAPTSLVSPVVLIFRPLVSSSSPMTCYVSLEDPLGGVETVGAARGRRVRAREHSPSDHSFDVLKTLVSDIYIMPC